MKVAFDENIPAAMVRVFQILADERQLKYLSAGLTIESAKDYTPRPGEPDYVAKSDVPWVQRFAAAGGKVIISGNTRMKAVPHERLALIQAGMVVVFFEGQWSGWRFSQKCALLLHWWPAITKQLKTAKPGSFWHIPCSWDRQGKLRKVSNDDAKALRIDKQKARQPEVAAARLKRRQSKDAAQSELFPARKADDETTQAGRPDQSG